MKIPVLILLVIVDVLIAKVHASLEIQCLALPRKFSFKKYWTYGLHVRSREHAALTHFPHAVFLT